MVDLPYDLWYQIAQFIPRRELRNLYSVNRTLYDIAMDERYKLINVYRHTDKNYDAGFLPLIHEPTRAQRVRTLYLRPTPLHIYFSKTPTNYTWGNALMPYIPGFIDENNTIPYTGLGEDALGVLNAVSMLSNVTTFYIKCHHDDKHSSFTLTLPVIETGWSAFGATLRNLTLDVPLQTLQAILYPSLHLKVLEDISMKLFVVESDKAPPIVALINSYVVPFVNKHRATVRSLSFSCSEILDPSTLLLGLEHFPHLKKFSLTQSFFTTLEVDTRGMHHVLANHADTLQELFLHFDAVRTYGEPLPSEDWFKQSFLSIPLPCLENLDIGLSEFPKYIIMGIINDFKHLYSSLESLALRGAQLSLDEIGDLLEHFRPGNRLSVLDIQVAHISPGLLDLLSTKFPFLVALKLKPWGFVKGGSSTGRGRLDQASQFCEEMKCHAYPKWSLRWLDIQPKSQCGGMKEACLVAVAASVSSVQLINGVPRLEYISSMQAIPRRHIY